MLPLSFFTRSAPRHRTLRLRCHGNGSDTAIVDVWNEAHRGLAGFVERSEELWRWLILERPGISRDDILLVQDADGRICAYGAIDTGGSVLDFVVRPGLPVKVGRQAARLLAEGLEERARAHGAPAIRVDVPAASPVVRRALVDAGYRATEGEAMTLSILNPAALVETILNHRLAHGDPALAELAGERFLIRIANGGYPTNPCRSMGIEWAGHPEDGKPESAPGALRVLAEPDDFRFTVAVDTDHSALTDLVFRRRDLETLEGDGAVAYAPPGSPAARGLLGLLPLRTSWHLPTADIL